MGRLNHKIRIALFMVAVASYIYSPASIHAQQSSQAEILKIALLPILDAFPCYVAAEKGYFRQHGIDVKVLPVASALERDQLMQSGAVDGMLNEMISTANFNRRRVSVKTIMIARKAYPRAPLFRILSSPAWKPASPSQVAGIAVGVSKNTIIEYVTDRLLAAEGLPPGSLTKKSIPSIPERYQLLIQGRLKIVTLPDPLAQSALAAGAGNIVDDSSYPQYSVSVLSFNINALDKKGESVRSFLRAWDRAAADINQDPEALRALLLRKIRVPRNIQQAYRIPPYPRREIPAESQWNDVMQWMVAKGLLELPLSYGGSITSAFLP